MKSAKAPTIINQEEILEETGTIHSVDGEVDATLLKGVRESDARAHASSIAQRIIRVAKSYVGQVNTRATHIAMAEAIEADLDINVPNIKLVDGQFGKDKNGMVNVGVIIEREPYIKELKCHMILDHRKPKIVEAPKSKEKEPEEVGRPNLSRDERTVWFD